MAKTIVMEKDISPCCKAPSTKAFVSVTSQMTQTVYRCSKCEILWVHVEKT